MDIFGAGSMPDKLIKEGLKQPDQIKVSFEEGTKEITGHVAPDQARFGAECFLTSVHASRFQVKDFDLTIGFAKGQWSIAV